MRSKKELLDLIYKDLHEVVQYYENEQERKMQGKKYKTDPFDGRRQNGGARTRAGAKPESMKHNINACKTFFDFDIEKRYGISKGSMLETEILVQLANCAGIILTRKIESQQDFHEVFKQMDIQIRLQNRQLRTFSKCLMLQRTYCKEWNIDLF